MSLVMTQPTAMMTAMRSTLSEKIVQNTGTPSKG